MSGFILRTDERGVTGGAGDLAPGAPPTAWPLSPQGWLQLGSKQRATAATGMNDKSSRSHSVLTLLLTRTQVGPASRLARLLPFLSVKGKRTSVDIPDPVGFEEVYSATESGLVQMAIRFSHRFKNR